MNDRPIANGTQAKQTEISHCCISVFIYAFVVVVLFPAFTSRSIRS
jgi:hypothetical protein